MVTKLISNDTLVLPPEIRSNPVISYNIPISAEKQKKPQKDGGILSKLKQNADKSNIIAKK